MPYPTPQLSASQTVRAGDTVQDLAGVLDYRFSEWRLQPTASPSFSQTNARRAEPGLEDRGNLVVASFNVLNFFNGDGMGGGFPTARGGADNPEELARQTEKLVSALVALDADIIGLMEIENDATARPVPLPNLPGPWVPNGSGSIPAWHNWAMMTLPLACCTAPTVSRSLAPPPL